MIVVVGRRGRKCPAFKGAEACQRPGLAAMCCARSPRQQARRCWSPGPQPFPHRHRRCRHGRRVAGVAARRRVRRHADRGAGRRSAETCAASRSISTDTSSSSTSAPSTFTPARTRYTPRCSGPRPVPPEPRREDRTRFRPRSRCPLRAMPTPRSFRRSFPDRRWPILAPWNWAGAVGVRHRLCGGASARAGRAASWALTLGEWLPTLGLVAGPMGRDAASVGGVAVLGQHRTGERAVGARGDDLRGESAAAQPARSRFLTTC